MDIYVGNLSYDTTDDDLRAAFSPYGTIASGRVVQDRETGRSRGFGFIEMPDALEAQVAIEAMNGKDLQGRTLTVNESRPRQSGGQGQSRGPRW